MIQVTASHLAKLLSTAEAVLASNDIRMRALSGLSAATASKFPVLLFFGIPMRKASGAAIRSGF